MKKLGIVLCCAGLAVVGCKKKDAAAGSGSGSADAPKADAPKVAAPAGAGSAAPAAPAGNKADCAPGAYMDPKGAFCVVVPAGYKSNDEATGGTTTASGSRMIVFNDDGGYTYSVEVVPKEDFENFKRSMVRDPNNTDGIKVLVNDKIGVDGTYQRTQNKEGETYQRGIVKRGEGYVVCEAAPKTPTNPEDACKTLRAL